MLPSRIRLVFVSLALAIPLFGCGDEDEKIINPPPPETSYVTPNTPRRAILNYALAWEKRDSLMIDSTIALDYQGTSVDMTDPYSGTLSFFKSDEVRAVGGLAGDASVTGVVVDFPDSSTWDMETFPGDPPDWVTITIRSSQIVILRYNSVDLMANSEYIDFKVRPTTAATGTRWTIVRWTEVNQGP